MVFIGDEMIKFKYIDLFAGIGGFHQAMDNLGGECVFASEIDEYARDTYKKNYNIDPFGDITNADVEKDIPFHDVLCAGFPCQSFSKAGKREGLDDVRGTLFFDIARILEYHKTKYIILENVRNLVSHDNGNTWNVISKTLKKLGYRLTEEPIVISPHRLGIPQSRERVIIAGVYDPKNIKNPLKLKIKNNFDVRENTIDTILQKTRVSDKYYLTEEENEILDVWNQFYKGIEEEVIGFPIWLDYFKKTYDDDMPDWKKNFINRNNELYKNNKIFIDEWLENNNNLNHFTSTNRKFEWQAGRDINNIYEGIIQFRPSGIRVKRPNYFPALVAMVQTPIIGKYQRRLTIKEAARLQSFPDDFISNEDDHQAYKQFGNAVNVKVVETVAKELFKE